MKTKQQTDRTDTERIISHVTTSKDEILKAINATRNVGGRPTRELTKRRGPKDTRMMKVQRTALIVYVTVELHKSILDVTLADAYHVWNDPENKQAWNEAAGRKDLRRGYKDYQSLYSAVKTLAEKQKPNLAKLTAV